MMLTENGFVNGLRPIDAHTESISVDAGAAQKSRFSQKYLIEWNFHFLFPDDEVENRLQHPLCVFVAKRKQTYTVENGIANKKYTTYGL